MLTQPADNLRPGGPSYVAGFVARSNQKPEHDTGCMATNYRALRRTLNLRVSVVGGFFSVAAAGFEGSDFGGFFSTSGGSSLC